MSAVLRAEGLTVGTPRRGAPCCRSAAPCRRVVRVRHPARVGAGARPGPCRRQHGGTADPGRRWPAGHRRGRPRRPVPGARHARARPRRADAPPSSAEPQQRRSPAARPPALRRRRQRTALSAMRRSYTSTQLANVFGLDQLFDQGRTGLGQTIAHRRVRAVPRRATSPPSSPATAWPTRSATSPSTAAPGGPAAGAGRPRSTSSWPPSTRPRPRSSSTRRRTATTSPPLDLFNRIASDDSAQVVTTSWGDCEASIRAPIPPTSRPRTGSSTAWPLQGQTMVAASGDSGPRTASRTRTSATRDLAVDDPGSQPDVVSAGGTTLPSASASSQVVWNNCQGQPSGRAPTAP